MRFGVLFLLLACLYLSLAQGTYENCCLKRVERARQSTIKRVVHYRVQETDGGCNLPAIVFTMKGGRTFCANPNRKWVQKLKKNIDERKA
ncbi:hypothetical protein ANANG_G00086340 [Anguilla anguilla]|uniref:Chemokine interleukin-8-like domain-containing protein n=1 Tax=Anguilla anguilla TaxID=7936 RepID=A0A9D3MMX3_ANGAN|nr:hypothetical protein ANANG_G00086340 [Anguilla anguilla]